MSDLRLGLSTGTRDPGTRCRVITRVVKFRPGTRENVASMSILTVGQTSAPMRLFVFTLWLAKQFIK